MTEIPVSPRPSKRAKLDEDSSNVETDTNSSVTVSDVSCLSSAAHEWRAGTVTIPAPAIVVGCKINCLRAVFFHPIRSACDFENPTISFSPLFVHHFFGLKEEIHGFSELCIKIFYTVDTLEMFVKVDASKLGVLGSSSNITSVAANNKQSSTETSLVINTGKSGILGGSNDITQNGIVSLENENPALTRILGYLSKISIPGGFHRTSTGFLDAINSKIRKEFHPPGVLSGSFFCKKDPVEIEIYKCSFDDPSLKGLEFQRYHRRVEWFLHFFIDACSNIDQDTRWTVLLLFAKHQQINNKPELHHELNHSINETCYELVGIVTLYKFYSFPLCRRRISQFMIFPHYQGKGIGFEVLRQVYREAIKDPDIGEITVEDPARSFAQLRDVVGIQMALQQGVIQYSDLAGPNQEETKDLTVDELTENIKKNKKIEHTRKETPISLPDNNKQDYLIYNKEFKKQLKKEIKECPQQIRRLIEIIALAKILPSNRHYPKLLDSHLKSEHFGGLTSRDWRQISYEQHPSVSESILHNEDDYIVHHEALKILRISIKKRLRMEQIETLSVLHPDEQRAVLQQLWERTYSSYCRTILKLRHQFKTVSDII